jgi:hypothetical protein
MEQDPVSLLKQMIVDKAAEHEAEKLLLMKQCHQAYESMKPINLLKGAVEGLLATSGLKTTIINGVLGFVAGIVVKKFANGKMMAAVAERLSHNVK